MKPKDLDILAAYAAVQLMQDIAYAKTFSPAHDFELAMVKIDKQGMQALHRVCETIWQDSGRAMEKVKVDMRQHDKMWFVLEQVAMRPEQYGPLRRDGWLRRTHNRAIAAAQEPWRLFLKQQTLVLDGFRRLVLRKLEDTHDPLAEAVFEMRKLMAAVHTEKNVGLALKRAEDKLTPWQRDALGLKRLPEGDAGTGAFLPGDGGLPHISEIIKH